MKKSESEMSMKASNNSVRTTKPPFVPAKDDTKPVLQDPDFNYGNEDEHATLVNLPTHRSDPIETEEAVLRLPPFLVTRSSNAQPKMT